jgi:hypothetical protein
MRVGLTYTQMKLARAKEHIEELDREISKFRNNPYTVVREDDANNAAHIIRCEMNIMPDPIGLLVGEVAYNLRSGLDHLAWQLALLTIDKPSAKTSFPIYSKKPNSSDKSFAEKLVNIPREATDIIESLQPYHRGAASKDHPLWKVNRLCNIDKHQGIAISYTGVPVWVAGVTTFWKRELTYGVQVTVPLSEKERVEFEPGIPEIVFGEPIKATDGISDFEVTLRELGSIYELLRYDVVPRFTGFFQ